MHSGKTGTAAKGLGKENNKRPPTKKQAAGIYSRLIFYGMSAVVQRRLPQQRPWQQWQWERCCYLRLRGRWLTPRGTISWDNLQAFWNNNAIISPGGGAVNCLHRIVTDMIPKSQFLSLVKKAKTR